MMNKSYEELSKLKSFEERFEYLKLSGSVGVETFGGARMLNQIFYTTPEWHSVRRQVIIRDEGCDLGILDRPLNSRIYVHHINPLNQQDIIERRGCVFDINNLICCSFNTHQAIHYSDAGLLIPSHPLERSANDQTPWRLGG